MSRERSTLSAFSFGRFIPQTLSVGEVRRYGFRESVSLFPGSTTTQRPNLVVAIDEGTLLVLRDFVPNMATMGLDGRLPLVQVYASHESDDLNTWTRGKIGIRRGLQEATFTPLGEALYEAQFDEQLYPQLQRLAADIYFSGTNTPDITALARKNNLFPETNS